MNQKDISQDSPMRMALLQSVFVCISQNRNDEVSCQEIITGNQDSNKKSTPECAEMFVSNITSDTDQLCVYPSDKISRTFRINESSLTVSVSSENNYTSEMSNTIYSEDNCGKPALTSKEKENLNGKEISISPRREMPNNHYMKLAKHSSEIRDNGEVIKFGGVENKQIEIKGKSELFTRSNSVSSSVCSSHFTDSDEGNTSGELSRSSSEEICLSVESNELSDEPTPNSSVIKNKKQLCSISKSSQNEIFYESRKTIDIVSPNNELDLIIKSSKFDSSLVQRKCELISELNNHFSTGNIKISKSLSKINKSRCHTADRNCDIPETFRNLFTPPCKSMINELNIKENHLDANFLSSKESADVNESCDMICESSHGTTMTSTTSARAEKDTDNVAMLCFVGFVVFAIVLVMSDPWSCNILTMALCFILCKYFVFTISRVLHNCIQ